MAKKTEEETLARARRRLEEMRPLAEEALRKIAKQTKDKKTAEKAKRLMKKHGVKP